MTCYDSIIASGDIPEASVVTDLFSPTGQEKSSQKINKRLKIKQCVKCYCYDNSF